MLPIPDKRRPELVNETARVEAFSDGVYAIAITLLILEIKVPHDVPPGKLADALLHLWPSYLAFAASFFSIGVMWMNHHRLFTLIGATDQRLLVFNTLLLFCVSFIPFPTAVLAQHVRHPDQRVAALLYNGTYALTAIIFNLLWRHASKENRLISPDADPNSVEAITRQYRVGPPFYISVVLLASFSALVTLLVHLCLAVFYALPPKRTGT